MEKSTQFFDNNKIPKEGSQYIFLSVTFIDSVFRIGNNYYPQVFLKECKYVVKEKKVPRYITDNIEISPDGSDRDNSNEENPDKENSDKKNSDEENFDEEN